MNIKHDFSLGIMTEINLEHFPLFAKLAPETRQAIKTRLYPYKLVPGQILIMEGEPAEHCYFIQHGVLRVLKMNTEGRVQVITRLHHPMPVNVISLLVKPRLNQASVEAISQTEVLVLSAADFDALITQYPDFSAALLQSLASRVSQMTDKIAELSLYPVSVRLARFILHLADSGKESNGWTQNEIAAQIGTTRDIVGRTLREFDRSGLIHHDRSEIILVDKPGLIKAAELPPED